jgi:membrane protease YdiL (CAAX protease family)
MRDDLPRIVVAAAPIIGILIAGDFAIPADMPWLARQLTLTGIGLGGVAIAELLLFGTTPAQLGTRLGIVIPRHRAIAAALLASVPMWAFLPLAAAIAGEPPHVAAHWFLTLVGVLLLNGVAEEVLHRSFIFGRLRERRTFFRAAAIGAGMFAAQHLYLVATLGPAGGMASVALALLLGFPFAYLFEQGGNSVVGPAILHTSSNASFLIFAGPDNIQLLPVHMFVVLGSAFLVFLVRCAPNRTTRGVSP